MRSDGLRTMSARLGRIGLRVAAGLTLLFLYVPIAIIAIYAFNDSRNQSWGNLVDTIATNGLGAFSLRWFQVALENDQVRDSFFISVQAALGATVEIPTPDGPVALKVPSGSESGKLLRVKGRGAPKLNGGGKGDLLARLRVTVPKKLTKAEKQALEAYGDVLREQPREHLARSV